MIPGLICQNYIVFLSQKPTCSCIRKNVTSHPKGSCYLTSPKERLSYTPILANQDVIDTDREMRLEPKPAATTSTSNKPGGSFRFGSVEQLN